MEQQRTAGVTERQVAEFIEDHQVGMREAVGGMPRFAHGLFLLQGIDQLDGREAAHGRR